MEEHSNSPLISIIVPVHNSERFLYRCIDSILRQNYSYFELILIDDGSIDSSGAICDEYANIDHRIVVIHQKNMGVSSARNNGLYIARGKYITFCDSDDELLPDYLAIMVNEPEDTGLVILGHQYVDENGNIIYSSHKNYMNEQVFIDENSVARIFLDEKLNYVWAKRFLSKTLHENHICFDDAENLGEDTLFVVAYICCCQSVTVKSNIVYNYRRYNANNLTGFNKSQYTRLKRSNRKAINLIKAKYPDFNDIYVWQQRFWLVCYYSIFSALKTNKMSLKEKNAKIKEIFRDKDFDMLLSEMDSLQGGNNIIVDKLFRMRSSELMIVYWKLSQIKKRIKKFKK